VERPVEVAVLERGELRAVRLLSPRRERATAWAAGAIGAGGVLGCMVAFMAWVSAAERVVHAPTFFMAWAAASLGVGLLAGRWARLRCSRYRIGVDMEADAFAPVEIDLVRRVGPDYDLGLAPGMTGQLQGGREALPIEALTARGPVRVPLPAHGHVRIEVGGNTFLVGRGAEAPGTFERLRLASTAGARVLARSATFAVLAATATSFLAMVPAAHAVSETDVRVGVARNATALEVERFIRARAQVQSGQLHRCFDPMPLSCHKPGYVNVVVSLSREGQVLAHRVTRTTYGAECPVTACMADVAARWVFEPIPEAMRVAIPIQVLRTRKAAVEARELVISDDPVIEALLSGSR
jgi:hypothetical protein